MAFPHRLQCGAYLMSRGTVVNITQRNGTRISSAIGTTGATKKASETRKIQINLH